ncbi:hypothetical protein F0562_010833 [Nyssa sinensis]|uniref:Uncharacterized protein n=1 Tax=Nyssa sinensis TaxID=561372 RepID=A0A5J5A0A0_9ASTE|nr:hypothetical protein F0562_010833 [Nyssa sinensis]
MNSLEGKTEIGMLKLKAETLHEHADGKHGATLQELLEAEDNDEMRRLQSESMAKGAEILTEVDICAQVLRRRPGYVRGLGHGMIAPLSSSRSLSAQIGDLNRRYQKEQQQNQELHSQIEQLIENMRIEVQSQV